MACEHHYVFSNETFCCTKCGHKTCAVHKSKNINKVSLVFLVIIIGIGVLFLNGVFEFNSENFNMMIYDIVQHTLHIKNTVKNFVEQDIFYNSTPETVRTDIPYNTNITRESISINQSYITKTIIPKNPPEKNTLNQKPVIGKTELEIQIHQLTNQYRIQNGLDALSWDTDLSNIARDHSQDMALQNYFSHETLDGMNPTDRGIQYNYQCQKTIKNLIYNGIAENIFQNNLYDAVWYLNDVPTHYDWNTLDEIAQTTVDGWMDSPGHRMNILSKTYDREGIGVEISTDDKVYITQNFC